MDAFDAAVVHVLEMEGGYGDHPDDPGGATNMGITLRTLASYRGKPVTKKEVSELSREEAIAIYKKKYWDRARCDDLPPAVAFMVFDAAVNHGVGRAIRLLQRSARSYEDGLIGPNTIAAVAQRGEMTLTVEYAAQRMKFYAGLSTFESFGLGWSRRLMAVLVQAALPAGNRP